MNIPILLFLTFVAFSGQESPPLCRLPVCPQDCPYGTVIENINGCDVCKCRPRVSCPVLPPCNIRCLYGLKMVDGCQVCECNPRQCPTLETSPRRCRFGFAADAEGPACPTAECRRPQTSVACPFPPCLALLDCFSGAGFVKGADGCPICRCAPPPQCPAIPPTCPRPCRYGYQFRKGCRTCRCNPPPRTCRAITCDRKICENGFASRRGCPTCSCSRFPLVVSPTGQCPPGVPIVNCYADPCSVTKCPRFPKAECRSNYCGGCNAVFFVKGRKVRCTGRYRG